MGDNRKNYNKDCGKAYKVLKLRYRSKQKITVSQQSNNQISKEQCRGKI
jgi:hypothetical protein